MTQSRALEVLLGSEGNVFLTGAPGSGKSYVLNAFIKESIKQGKKLAVTASTGIAASLLGGTTLHSWAGLGFNKQENEEVKWWLVNRINEVNILIIDEVSMLDGATFDRLDVLLRRVRKNHLPFGGMKIVLSGDFFQLPPVGQGGYLFCSQGWTNLNLNICYITEQHRQKSDELIQILSALRERRFNSSYFKMLLERQIAAPPNITRLMTHNSGVDRINSSEIGNLKGQTYSYEMQLSGDIAEAHRLEKSLLAPQKLVLKVEAPVMFVANDFAAGYVNGSQGTVVRFKNGLPLVKLKGGPLILVNAHQWSSVNGNKHEAKIIQLPLRLAWAITIHKSQGMSLDQAEIDLDRSFMFGMGYVALSRLKTYLGLYLSGINSRSLELNPLIYDFDRQLHEASNSIDNNHIRRRRNLFTGWKSTL